MAKAGTFQCSIITPERAVLDCQAEFVAFPAYDGEMGILTQRAPLVCKLGIGPLRINGDAGSHTFYVDGGFAQMADNRLTILTEAAMTPDEIDTAAAEEALTEANAMIVTDDASLVAREKATQRANAQLRMGKP